MLTVTLEEADGIAILEPSGELTENDFIRAASLIDPLIEEKGKLAGIIIHTRAFPGWDSFSAMVGHLKFVKHHHEKIERMALVTDSMVKNIGEKLVTHFVGAEIKAFDYDAMEDATAWIRGGTE